MSELARKDVPFTPPAGEEELEQLFAQYQDELLGTLFYMVGNLDEVMEKAEALRQGRA